MIGAAMFGPTPSALCVPARLAASRRGTPPQSKKRKRPAKGETGGGSQQPADVVARRTAQRMRCANDRSLQPALIHPVIRLRTADQRLDRRGTACSHRCLIRTQLALQFAHHRAQNRALACDRLAAQRLAFLGAGLLAYDACPAGRTHHLVARDLQQLAVYRVGVWVALDCTVPMKNCHSRFSAQRSTNASSLGLKLCLR